jgi:hypothetical protein
MNRLASLRLTECWVDILISVRGKIVDAGYAVVEEHAQGMKAMRTHSTSFAIGA